MAIIVTESFASRLTLSDCKARGVFDMRNNKHRSRECSKPLAINEDRSLEHVWVKALRRLGVTLSACFLVWLSSDATKVPYRASCQSRSLQVFVEYSSSNRYPVGSMIVVQVTDPSLASNSARGHVRITSESTRYDSGVQSMAFSRDGASLYYHWTTTGLKAAIDYDIEATIDDSTGSRSERMRIALSPPVTKLIRVLASVEDLRLPFKDIGLHFTRYYRYDSAYEPYKGPVGYGWTHEFGSVLTESTDGYVSLLEGNGKGRYFQNSGNGAYISPRGDNSKLTRAPDGSFTLRSAGGNRWRFRDDLRLDFYQNRNSNKVSCGYDSQGNLVSLSDESGQEIRFVNDSQGRIVSATDSTGRSVHYSYNQAGDLQSVTDAIGNVTVYRYEDRHRLIEIDLPDGRHRFFSYDADGRLARLSADGGANSLTLTYDTATGAQTITDASGRAIVARTNEGGLITDWQNGLGNTVKLEYDDKFSLTRYTDEKGSVWEIIPDTRGNPTSITDPVGNIVASTYSTDFNQITSLTDAKTNRTQFDYDDTGERTRILYPDDSTETYRISDQADRRTIQKKTRDGRTITYVYNRNGLLESKMLPDGVSFSYGYDPRGNLVSASNNWGTIIFDYDLLNRRTRTIYPGARSFAYEYDAMSRRARMTDPDGRVLEYSYDAAGRLSRITSPTEGSLVEYQYNPDGRPARRILLNGTATEYEYDAAAQLTGVTNSKGSGAIVSRWRYEYDASGHRSKKTGTEGGEAYAYDKISQLVGITYADATTEAYQYDPAGNRSAVTKNGTREKWKGNNSLNQYNKAAGVKYDYDANGNLIMERKARRATYEYDVENHIVRAQVQNGESVRYAYDAFGRLASRTDTKGTVNLLWDGDQIAIEEGPAHSTVARYTWGRTLDEVIAMRRANKDWFYFQDALVSVTELTDGAGNVVEQYRYRAFGEGANSSQVSNPFLFTGAFYDSQTGLYNMRARWYSPGLGRFMQTDPIGISGGVNLYAYVSNDPVNRSDPFGLEGPLGDYFNDFQGRIGEPIARLGGHFGAEDIGPPTIGGNPGGGFGGTCPTFIQPPPEGTETIKSSLVRRDAGDKSLTARIDVPINGALLRSDIPIFGIAAGNEFKEYRVEYGEGKNPIKWRVIESSNIPRRTNDVGLDDLQYMQGDVDIRGNLATWNTGLKEWVHLPWHAPEDRIDLNGTYTIRLVVTGRDGKTVEDRVTCEVGRVIAQCLPGIAVSTDKKVTMHFAQQSIQSAFRVYTIKPLTSGVPAIPDDQSLIRTVYTIREPGDRFMKPVTLRFDVRTQTNGRSLDQLGIFSFNCSKRAWELLQTVQGSEPETLETTVCGLPEKAAYFAVFASRVKQRQSIARQGATAAPVQKVSTALAPNQPILVSDTFETDTGQWVSRDREFGATISREKMETPNGSYALKITNDHFGGDFACTVLSSAFRADDYSLVSFDYKVSPGVETDFYVRAGDTWYNIGFTDDETDFRYKDVGISRIGRIEGIIADGKWHSTRFDLDRMLATKTGGRLVEEIVMADWDVSGYMKLDFGRNAHGATLYIDNFNIRRGAPDRLASDEPRGELTVDDFGSRRATNLLGGGFGVFSNPGANNCVLDIVPRQMPGEARTIDYALKLKYDATRRGSYAGLWSDLRGASLERFDQLSLKVRIVSGSTNFMVGLKNDKKIEVRLPVDGYFEPPDSLGWKRLKIPLAAFSGLGDMSSLTTFSISFTEADNSGTGEIMVDDIKFQKGVDFIPIVDFEERVAGKNRLGQNSWVFFRGAAAVSANLDSQRAADRLGHCLRISFGGDIGLDLGKGDFSYAAWATGLGGVDASGANYLKFRVKGQKAGEEPNVYLDDGTRRKCVGIGKYVRVTTDWREALIPLDDFRRQGVDLTHLGSLQLVFEWKPMSSTLYVDDIAFSSASPP